MFDIFIDEGTTFELCIALTEVSINPVTGEEVEVPSTLEDIQSISSVVKADFTGTAPVLLTFNTSILGAPANGEILLTLADTATSGLVQGNIPVVQLGYYDVVLTKTTGSKVKLIGGKVFINQGITAN